jgi:hypothetical protein
MNERVAPEQLELGANVVPLTTTNRPASDEFDWGPNNPDLICAHQPALAVYLNNYNQIVLLAQAGSCTCDACGDDAGDVHILVSRHYVAALIRRLQQLVK